MESQRFLVNGVHLGVVQQGALSHPRHTLVLLHGFTGSAANWSEILPSLSTSDRRLIALDLLGHGQADAPTSPERYSIEHCQSDILALLRKLGVREGEATLLGYSMGGRIALYTALSGFFRGLILESASPGLATEEERAARRQSDQTLAALIERGGVAAFVNTWERLPLFASQQRLSPDIRAALHQQRLGNRVMGLANSLRGVGTGAQPSLHTRLGELKMPVLVLAGKLDPKFCGIAREMTQALPQATLQIVPDAGHTVHLEQPALFAEFVNRFIDALC